MQLYAAGETGYGGKSIALLSSTVPTDAGGRFIITGYYSCPNAAAQVYVAATSHQTLALMAALGNCGDITGSTTATLNELTTVAAVWPLAQFMSGVSGVGTSATNVAGLRHAFLNSARLVNSAAGTLMPSDPVSTTAVQTLVPGNELNTLANVLAPCAGSGGSTGADTACGKLFAAATTVSSAAPTDTVAAALNIALHPLVQVDALYGLTSAASPYSPQLGAAPVDWLVPLTYQYDDIYSGPAALDGVGNFWIAGASSLHTFVAGFGQNAETFHNYALVRPTALALDQNQNLWITQSYFNATNGLFEFSPSGSAMPCGRTCGPFTGGGITSPEALAVDAQGNIWVRNDDGVLSEFSSSGTPISPAAGYRGLGISDTSTPYVDSGVYTMAFDPAGALWVPDEATNSVLKVTPGATPGAAPTSVRIAGGGLSAPYSVAIDHTGAAWIGSPVGNTLTRFNHDGSVAIPAFSIGDGCSLNWMTIDGAGTLWTSSAGNTPAGVCEVSSAGKVILEATASSTANGDGPDSYVTVDASGSLWEATGGYFYSGGRQYLGAAVPTGASLADALKNGTLATRP